MQYKFSFSSTRIIIKYVAETHDQENIETNEKSYKKTYTHKINEKLWYIENRQ